MRKTILNWLPFTTSVAVCLAVLLAPRPGQTQTTTPTTTATTLTKADFRIELYKREKDEWVFLSGTSLDTFFNRARCQCDARVQVRLILLPSGRSKVGTTKRATLKMRAGDQSCVCVSNMGVNTCMSNRCIDLGSSQDLTGLVNRDLEFETTVQKLFAVNQAGAGDGQPVCDRDTKVGLWVWMDSLDDSDQDTELTDVTTEISIDGLGPAAPTGLSATGGNDALEVKWNQVTSAGDFQGYQVLCSRNGDLVVFPNRYKAGFDSAATCPDEKAAALSVGGPTDDAPVTSDENPTDDLPAETAAFVKGAPPEKLASVDPAYVCSDVLTSGTSSRLFRLQNGIPYAVGVVTLDKRRNASAITEVVLEKPTPTVDFYAGYRSAGGKDEGGFCTMASGRGPAPGGAAWLMSGLGLAGLLLARRRGRSGPADTSGTEVGR